MRSMSWSFDTIQPRVRVISDNDYCGDPDGLVQLAHHLLSPSVDVRPVIGSKVAAYDPGARSAATADDSAEAARRIAELAGRSNVAIVPGANDALGSRAEPVLSEAADAIVAEAMRDDSDIPLFVVCGGGLTNIASAWLIEPRIAARLTLVWIGGREHAALASPPSGALAVEYNTSVDLLAAQVVFNDSDLVIWQAPRDAYGQVIACRSELLLRMRPHGALGEHLSDALGRAA